MQLRGGGRVSSTQSDTQSVCARLKDWRCHARVTSARSLCQTTPPAFQPCGKASPFRTRCCHSSQNRTPATPKSITHIHASHQATHLFKNMDDDTVRNIAPDSLAIAFASNVLPTPGGPNSSKPLGVDSSREAANSSGLRNGSMIRSLSSSICK